MKINYTLPGYQPELEGTSEVTESFDSPFQNRMRVFERRQPVAWRDLLGLNQTPPDPGQVGAPPSNSAGPATEPEMIRQQWRQLLSRHSGSENSQSTAAPVRRMLGVLRQYQVESEKLVSRSLEEEAQ